MNMTGLLLVGISGKCCYVSEVMDHIDLSRYFVEKGYKTGCPRGDEQKLRKVILFAFMKNGICSLREINAYIFDRDHVDLQHTYIDGTKIEANANRYTWVWKKSCMKNRQKVLGVLPESTQKSDNMNESKYSSRRYIWRFKMGQIV